ncbi:MAG: 3-oxoacyl-[acyl-carrier-protein] reductase [Phycisphaerae bacterium]|nr:3-oxoacyl-[acyl-carrier-protein] reductase [Phycisphaerae bacterium]MBT5583059.1 3-oxoacyl-[acyl-carrier-protein] reductase [Phycisphaerae bacterium]
MTAAPDSDQIQRIALVTGASRGLGKAIATQLAADGHHVVLVARSADAIEAVSADITSSGGSAECRPCDLSDDAAVDALLEDVVESCGRLDILVNNAGITRDGLILRMSDEDFDAVITTNLRAAFRLCRAAARPMMRGRWGRMINIGSVVGVMGNPGQANYAAAKAGLIGMTKSIGKELGGKGITANVVAPGFIGTDMTDALPEQLVKEAVAKLPLKRLGLPEEIANAVSFLASEKAAYITGHVLAVDGGLLS